VESINIGDKKDYVLGLSVSKRGEPIYFRNNAVWYYENGTVCEEISDINGKLLDRGSLQSFYKDGQYLDCKVVRMRETLQARHVYKYPIFRCIKHQISFINSKLKFTDVSRIGFHIKPIPFNNVVSIVLWCCIKFKRGGVVLHVDFIEYSIEQELLNKLKLFVKEKAGVDTCISCIFRDTGKSTTTGKVEDIISIKYYR